MGLDTATAAEIDSEIEGSTIKKIEITNPKEMELHPAAAAAAGAATNAEKGNPLFLGPRVEETQLENEENYDEIMPEFAIEEFERTTDYTLGPKSLKSVH